MRRQPAAPTVRLNLSETNDSTTDMVLVGVCAGHRIVIFEDCFSFARGLRFP
ncbi:MAG TPA: hypothetical protein VK608_02470 [Edaphobacter sp.]|nr:hypothetical protein [Edaphobacter sp.]